MTLRELIAQLWEEDLDLEISLSSDGEGNDYSPLASFEIGYLPDEDDDKRLILYPVN